MTPAVVRIVPALWRAMNMNRQKCATPLILLTLVSVLLLAGCSALQAPQVENPHIYTLDARPALPARQTAGHLVLLVSMPRARPGFDTPQMAYLRQPHELNYFAVNRWADAPSHMLWPLLAQALEQTGNFRAVVQTPGPVSVHMRLDTELVRLQQDFGTQPSRLQFTVHAQLIDVIAKRVVAAKLFDESEDAPSDDAYGGVIAANRVAQRLLDQLADFCISESAGRRTSP